MADQAALMRTFAEYARTISRRYDIGDVLYRLTDQVTDVLDIDGAGVSLAAADGSLQFVTATDDHIVHVEERQLHTGEGPCHDAFTSGARVTAADLRAEERWPAYTPFAVEQGCRAAAGLPLLVDDQRIGALNLYVYRPREWPADELDTAEVLADMATGYIINARALSESEQLTGQLQRALDSRVVIEQAKGRLAERHDIDPAAAFQLLRKHARDHSRKVPDVARAVLDGSLQL